MAHLTDAEIQEMRSRTAVCSVFQAARDVLRLADEVDLLVAESLPPPSAPLSVAYEVWTWFHPHSAPYVTYTDHADDEQTAMLGKSGEALAHETAEFLVSKCDYPEAQVVRVVKTVVQTYAKTKAETKAKA